MTYRELYKQINDLPEERKDDDVTVFVRGIDEYYKIEEDLLINMEDDVLDEGHAFLVV